MHHDPQECNMPFVLLILVGILAGAAFGGAPGAILGAIGGCLGGFLATLDARRTIQKLDEDDDEGEKWDEGF